MSGSQVSSCSTPFRRNELRGSNLQPALQTWSHWPLAQYLQLSSSVLAFPRALAPGGGEKDRIGSQKSSRFLQHSAGLGQNSQPVSDCFL